MKNILKIGVIVLFFVFGLGIVEAAVFEIGGEALEIEGSSIDVDVVQDGDPATTLVALARTILGILKNILSAVIVLFLVYAGAMMVFSMGADDEKLSSSRNQIWYAAIGLLFINIPGTLYNVFNNGGTEINELGPTNADYVGPLNSGNMFLDVGLFEDVFFNQIVRFMQISIFGLAILVIILAGYKILTAAGKDENIAEARTKILYSVVALFFVGFIEALKRAAYAGKITADGNGDTVVDLFSTATNLILMFAVPVALFFLFLATFYYITSGGDEDKVKKAKNIVLNTFLATILLLAIYAFVLDLVTI